MSKLVEVYLRLRPQHGRGDLFRYFPSIKFLANLTSATLVYFHCLNVGWRKRGGDVFARSHAIGPRNGVVRLKHARRVRGRHVRRAERHDKGAADMCSAKKLHTAARFGNLTSVDAAPSIAAGA